MQPKALLAMVDKLCESMNNLADCYNMPADGLSITEAHSIARMLDSMAAKTEKNVQYLRNLNKIMGE